MIYELRTYDIKPRTVDQFGENTKLKLEGRLKFSDLGHSLFTDWAIPFEVASLVLLVALIGAIVISKQGEEE